MKEEVSAGIILVNEVTNSLEGTIIVISLFSTKLIFAKRFSIQFFAGEKRIFLSWKTIFVFFDGLKLII